MTHKLTPEEKGVVVSRIQAAMARRRMNLTDLHKKVCQILGPTTRGTSYGAIWNYVNQPPTNPRIEILEAIGTALNEPIEWLLYGERDPAKTDELASVFDEMLSQKEPGVFEGLSEEIADRAWSTVRFGTPLMRAMFLNTLRIFMEYQFPDGYSRQDLLTSTHRLSDDITHGFEKRMGMPHTFWEENEWEQRCVARMHAIDLSIPAPINRRRTGTNPGGRIIEPGEVETWDDV